ncbi:MAG: hypothetical protein AB2693_03100 [Candidatus Thiodiazotropha sp.]
MIRALGLKGKTKIADDWEEMPYIVTEIPNKDIPVYKVQQENGKGRVKTLHRNQLLPFSCLPSDHLLSAPPGRDRGAMKDQTVVKDTGLAITDSPPDTESDSSEIGDSDQSADDTPSAEKYRCPMRRNLIESMPQQGRANRGRPQRIRKPPGWLMTGQWATQYVQ